MNPARYADRNDVELGVGERRRLRVVDSAQQRMAQPSAEEARVLIPADTASPCVLPSAQRALRVENKRHRIEHPKVLPMVHAGIALVDFT